MLIDVKSLLAMIPGLTGTRYSSFEPKISRYFLILGFYISLWALFIRGLVGMAFDRLFPSCTVLLTLGRSL
ncbi:hypothetical protein BDN72DRAFT_835930 [Pluteus cervinus]|uniref:Uncharacterized protein n=1 Tax=Pluteus cervinus TaxID=181527 RepID=A0ACD3B4S9_9AGAR|nr:hypothetical protein BDN72DRAFT_835930 [Pluteus cervinus]